ncbi:MAG: HAD-IA family hydrolase [Desulfobacterales bacterium]|nr:HAD-IA family hydrolase [Desulfobacterales bacterium]
MKNIKVIAFDCDGVMFDTTQANTAFYNRILQHFGKEPMSPDQFKFVHMHTPAESVAHILGDQDLIRAAEEYRKNVDYQPFIRLMEIEPGLKSLLKKLRGRYHTAIATNRAETIHRVLAAHGLENDFDLVVNALDVKHPKPHPEQLLTILEHFKISAAQALYVGDSPLDEAAARAAGVPFAAYDNRSLGAGLHIRHLRELEKILAV